ncbi:MAG: FAD-binding oxidoreductase [Pseudomonadota bacterium]
MDQETTQSRPIALIGSDDLAALSSVVGEKGVISGADAEPLLEEWRGRWHGKPSIVLAPGSVEEVAQIVKICAAKKIPVTPQGGNTGLVGGQIPERGEVLISLRRLNRVRAVDPLDNTMVVDAGVTLSAAQQAAADVGRLFPLSIGSEGSCQIGGIISTNAGGVNVLRYGNTRDLILGLEVVTPQGDIWHGLKRLRKDNTGYDLKHLFIGGEGTLGIVTGASVRLFPQPAEKVTSLVGVSGPQAALSLLAHAQGASGGAVSSFELMGRPLIELCVKNIAGVRDPLDEPHPWYVLMELSSGEKGHLTGLVESLLGKAVEDGLVTDGIVAGSLAQADALWHMRHAASESMKAEGAQAKFDVSVPISSVPGFLATAETKVNAVCRGARIIAFGHMGDGNVHYDILQPTDMSAENFRARQSAIEDVVYDTIGSFDGSISAEHGVGVARRDDVAHRKSPVEMTMMRAVKKALDPDGIMNPDKLLSDLSPRP